MKNLTLTKNILSIILFIFFSSCNLFAQTEFCNIEVKVRDSETKEQINDFELQAVNIDKKILYKSNEVIPNLVENVLSGVINISVSKEKYIDKFHRISVDCKDFSKNNSKQIEIFLEKKKPAGTKNNEGPKGVLMIGNSSTNNSTLKPINSSSLNLGKPSYPAAARATRASGAVQIQVVIDLDGNVIFAKAISGHPLLRSVSEKAAVESKFKPTTLSGEPVMVSGIIVYNFVP